MKKIIMFVGAAACALGVQAASIDWSIDAKSFTMSDDSKPNGVTVYLFDTGADGYSDFLASLTGGTAGDSISASTLTGGAGYLGSGTTYSSTKAALVNANYGKANGTLTVDTAGKSYNLAAIILDNGKFMAVNGDPGISYASSPDDGSAAAFGAAVFSTAGGWATYTPASTPDPDPVTPAPEPTSGLLLLVGGAMLALRRKQK